MNLDSIQAEAMLEKPYIDDKILHIKRMIVENPNGMDITLPRHLITHIEAYCDANRIPLYAVAEDCVSVAATYTDLLAHEKAR